jgi:glucosylceramidase
MGDPETRKYVDGTAFHWYSGSQFENLAAAHEAAPDRFLLGTEACTCPPDPNDWTKGEKYAYDIMGDLNNWAVGWTDWNMLLDKQGGPNHLNNFCDAPIIADVAAQSISFQNPYYYMGQITRFILPGARIIKTTSTLSQDQLSVVSALNPDGSVAVVLLNQSESPISINLIDKGVAANSVVPARSIVTLTYFR